MHIGANTNSRTTPADIGMSEIAAKKSADFIGKRSLSLPFAVSEEREQLVGLHSTSGPLTVGGRILESAAMRPPCPTVGYVTSACASPTAGNIALALIERGFARLGETVHVYDAGRIVDAEICSRAFIDPDNARVHG